MYPEPERSRLESAYRAEHARYCDDRWVEFKIDMAALVSGIAISVAILFYFI